MERRQFLGSMPFAFGGALGTGALPQIAQAAQAGGNAGVAQSRGQISNIDPGIQQALVLSEPGREGLFVWKTGDFSEQVASDTCQGVYVASQIAPTSGVWMRAFEGPVSVKWFGASGNGTTDDTAALQGAINYVQNQSVSNYWSTYFGEVYLPSGDYLVTGITISAPIVFGGSGSQACSISLQSGSNRDVITIASPPLTLGSKDSFRYSGRLRGFTINGNGNGQSSTSNGVYVSNSVMTISQRYDGSVGMEDIIVRSARDTGIYIGVNRNYGSMRSVSVVYCNVGVQNNGYDWRISDCDFGNSASTCYWQFEGGATHISGTNMYKSGAGTGMVLSSQVNAPCMISGCYFDTNAMHGIYIESDGSAGVRHNLMNNVFRDNSSSSDGGYAHIYVNNLAGGVFVGNTFIKTQNQTWCPGYVVYVQGTSSLLWSGSYDQSLSGKPFAVAITNAPSSLVTS